MYKLCTIIGALCILFGIFSCIENPLFGIQLISTGLLLVVLAQHLFNQAQLIEATRQIACPQLFYAELFAPSILKKKVIEEDKDLVKANINLGLPTVTEDGTFRIRGRVSFSKGLYSNYTDFIAIITPGESYHLKSDWEILKFDWL